MRKFIDRTSKGYKMLIFFIFFFTSIIARASFDYNLDYLFDTTLNQILEKFYMSQLIVFMINSCAFVYLIGSVYQHSFTPTNLSFLLSRGESKEDIKKYLSLRAIIPYLIVTLVNSLIFFFRYKEIVGYDSDVVFDPVQIMILFSIFCITIATLISYYKTDRVFNVSVERIVTQYIIFIFGITYTSTILNEIPYSVRGTAFIVFILVIIGENIMNYLEIKSNKKIDIC